jgi:hypothetical protein
MPAWGPIHRRDFVRAMRQAGFTGPIAGGRHQLMRRGSLTVPIPNPHRGAINIHLLSRILREAKIDRKEWERL